MSDRRVYASRVKDTGHDPKWKGEWHQVKTNSNTRGEWSTRKQAQTVLNGVLENDHNLMGHVFTYVVSDEPTLESIKIDDWLFGNLVPIASVPEQHRKAYSDTVHRMALAAARYGHRVYISSSYRTLAEQEALYRAYLAGGTLAAKPGTSLHGKGRALDVPNARNNPGLIKQCRGLKLIDDVPSEPWHLSNHAA